MRASVKSMVLATAFVVAGAGLASADVEPNDWLYQAEPTGATTTGTIATQNEADWYVFTAASQTQLKITLTSPSPNACSNDLYAYLLNSDGGGIDSTYADDDTTGVITYTTPAGSNRFFLKVRGYYCVGKSYRIDMTPATNLTAGPAMPTPTAFNPEPNENGLQAVGPLTGDVTYRGTIDTENDEDWFYFNAGAAFDIITTGVSGCDMYTYLYLGDDNIDYSSTGSNRLSHLTYTPTGWQQFRLKLSSSCVADPYHFVITPGSALAPELPQIAPIAPPDTAPITTPTTGPAAPSAKCLKARSAKLAAKAKKKRLVKKLNSATSRRARRIAGQKLRHQVKVVRFTTRRAAARC